MSIAEGDLDVLSLADQGGVELRLFGELNWLTSEVFTDAVREHLRELPAGRCMRLNFAGCVHCDSAGVAALVYAWKWTRRAQVGLSLEQCPPFLDRLLVVTGLHAVFDHAAPTGHGVDRAASGM